VVLDAHFGAFEVDGDTLVSHRAFFLKRGLLPPLDVIPIK
jgi:hypothetical protein